MRKFNPNIPIMINLVLSEKVIEKYENKKMIIPVPIFEFGIILISAKNTQEFKEKVLFAINRKEKTLKEIEKILNLENLSPNDLEISFSVHFYDKDKNLYNYTIRLPFTKFLGKLDEIFKDIKKYIDMNKDKKFLTIQEISTSEKFKSERHFIEIIKEMK